jgi:hypothetical protein
MLRAFCNTEDLMSIRKLSLSSAILLGGLVAAAPQAHATFLATLMEVGSDVVGTGSGTINTSALNFLSPNSDSGFIFPVAAVLGLGPAAAITDDVDTYGSFSGPVIFGPSSFGSGTFLNASSGSGDYVEINDLGGPTNIQLNVPHGYVSGTPLSDTSTWLGQTFASLGVTPGTYTWTWGSGVTADSYTLEVITPEPGSLILLGLGTLALALLGRCRIFEPKGSPCR